VSLGLIGVGNPWRSDDRLGLLVSHQLQDMIAATTAIEAVVYANQGDITSLLDALSRHESMIIVDAMASRTLEPGQILRIDVSQTPLPTELNAASSHMVSVSQAIELARALGQLPCQLIVYTMEGARFEMGEELSPSVQKNLPLLIDKVYEEMTLLAKGPKHHA